MYYDRAGSVITEDTWKAYWADEQYRMLARTDVGEWTVAAWWAGVDGDGNGGDRVFRTALLVPPRQAGYGSPLLQEWRHASAELAMAHHNDLVARLHSDDLAAPANAEPTSQSCHSCH
jgi:hypothetical protein